MEHRPQITAMLTCSTCNAVLRSSLTHDGCLPRGLSVLESSSHCRLVIVSMFNKKGASRRCPHSVVLLMSRQRVEGRLWRLVNAVQDVRSVPLTTSGVLFVKLRVSMVFIGVVDDIWSRSCIEWSALVAAKLYSVVSWTSVDGLEDTTTSTAARRTTPVSGLHSQTSCARPTRCCNQVVIVARKAENQPPPTWCRGRDPSVPDETASASNELRRASPMWKRGW
jgi:hypothetical protein